MGSSGATLDRVQDQVKNIGCKGVMGHARHGSCRGCRIDEIHAFILPITVVGA
jgi:hypothetical protein